MRTIILATLLVLLSGCALGAPGSDIEVTITNEPAPDATQALSLEMLCQQKGYTWNASESTCSYSQEGNPIIEIFYPIELVYYPLIDSTMESYINDYRTAFEDNFAQHGANAPGPFQLSLRYTIYQHSENIISIHWTESFYTGGANVGLEFTTFTFDKSTGQIVAFPDLFAEGVDPLTTVMQAVRDQLNVILQGISSPEQINNGTDELSDYSNFVLSDTALIILFEPYTVAAGAAGPQQVELPLSDLATALKPQFQ